MNYAKTYLTTSQVMDLLHIKSRTTLIAWRRKDYLVPSRVGGKNLYKASDVKKLLKGKPL